MVFAFRALGLCSLGGLLGALKGLYVWESGQRDAEALGRLKETPVSGGEG